MKTTMICAAVCSALLFSSGPAFSAEAPANVAMAQLRLAPAPVAVSETTEKLREDYAATPAVVEAKDAATLASEFVQKAVDAKALSFGEGWNEEQKTYVAVSTAYLPMKGLSAADFVRLRSMKFNEASLTAKASVIQFVRTDLSVENLVTMPDTGLGTAYDQENEAVRRAIEEAAAELQSLMTEVDETKAREVGGVNVEDLVLAGFAARMRELIGEIDIDDLTAKQKARLEALEKRVAETQSRLDGLKKKAEELRGMLQQENVNTVETFASMPLLGAMTIGTFESVTDGQYQVSVVLSWSAAQERFVRSVFEGKVETTKMGRQSLNDYLKGVDYASAIGGRKMLDDKGQMHLIGFGAWPIVGNGSAAARAAEGQARLQAQSGIALALRADVSSHEMAQSKGQELRGKQGDTETQVAENFAQQLSESVKNMQLQGVSVRGKRTVKDPFTGQKMMVVAMSMSVGDSVVAKAMEKSNYAAAEEQTKANQTSKGLKDGMDASLKAQEADTKAYAAGYAEGRNATAEKSAAAQKAAAKPAAQPAPKAEPAVEETTRPEDVGNRSQTGAGTSVDAFGF